jgi:hypothetical protein
VFVVVIVVEARTAEAGREDAGVVDAAAVEDTGVDEVADVGDAADVGDVGLAGVDVTTAAGCRWRRPYVSASPAIEDEIASELAVGDGTTGLTGTASGAANVALAFAPGDAAGTTAAGDADNAEEDAASVAGVALSAGREPS